MVKIVTGVILFSCKIVYKTSNPWPRGTKHGSLGPALGHMLWAWTTAIAALCKASSIPGMHMKDSAASLLDSTQNLQCLMEMERRASRTAAKGKFSTQYLRLWTCGSRHRQLASKESDISYLTKRSHNHLKMIKTTQITPSEYTFPIRVPGTKSGDHLCPPVLKWSGSKEWPTSSYPIGCRHSRQCGGLLPTPIPPVPNPFSSHPETYLGLKLTHLCERNKKWI